MFAYIRKSASKLRCISQTLALDMRRFRIKLLN